ncbi:hypothetical protein BO70DRAFT_349367 [Aspergillus heteromorphus CBS 117.55]|uniref:Uncharacterized protein n=1 Tax=Aspergillus heteromorphus CBS 117.55 TaxID=1448321 RepID=A0A317WWP2_9EURO|nr:uncharacterized protein BO70DRAFT_349367 [Aspergillus heteromorphus CBS 117.55]PWY90804.1 hypothetical protein BO70DRAFT_349367 [Aspergillus heteromorphus CBS 117.55]
MPIFPTICLLLSLIFLACLHHRAIRSYFAPQHAPYTRLDHHSEEFPSEPSNPTSPLAKYFDPTTDLLRSHILEPPSPCLPLWEEDIEEEGWVDRAVDRVVGWVIVRVH